MLTKTNSLTEINKCSDYGCYQVVLYSANLTNIYNLTGGRQIGSYFGYSLAASDLNGDGLDDMIIGEFAFIQRKKPVSHKYSFIT